MTSILSKLFEYKAWANEALLTLASERSSTVPSNDWRTFVRILNHTHVVDQIFAAHLQGQAHGFHATNTEATPAIAQLRGDVVALDRWYVQYVKSLADAALSEVLPFRFTDGLQGAMSREEMLHHVVVHGTYHRGAAGRILAQHGIQPPPDSPSVFFHFAEPLRRQA